MDFYDPVLYVFFYQDKVITNIILSHITLKNTWSPKVDKQRILSLKFFYEGKTGCPKKLLTESCWNPKILTNIECCGATFSHGYDFEALNPA